jgi:hypothetical protein
LVGYKLAEPQKTAETRYLVELEFEIASPEWVRGHAELHHYTTFEGLRGIVESNTIWATHFAQLNDSTEVTLLQRPMNETLSARALSILQSSANRRMRRAVAKAAGVSEIEDATQAFVGALFAAAFTSDGRIAEPLAEPYITSFCAHSANQAYEINNGLLSQWRAYGGAGRYCIVFDTASLVNLLLREFDSFYWVYMRLAEVNYAVADVRLETLFPDLLESCEKELVDAFGGGPIEISARTMVEFFPQPRGSSTKDLGRSKKLVSSQFPANRNTWTLCVRNILNKTSAHSNQF